MNTKYFILLFMCLPLVAHTQAEKDSIVNALGEKLNEAFYNADTSKIYELIDFKGIVKTALGKEDSLTVNGFSNGFKESFTEGLIQNIQNGVYFDYLKYSKKDSKYYLLFRLYSIEGGLNYHQYDLKEEKAGQFLIDDIYFYSSGEYITTTLKNMMGNLEETDYLVLLQINRIKNLRENGKLKEAREVFKSLPQDMQNNKVFKLLQLGIIEDDTEYFKVFETYETLFPNDPSLYLISLDKFMMEKKYDNSINYINKLQELTGDDFLEYLKGNVFTHQKDYKSAAKHYEYIAINYPSFDDNLFNLIFVYNELGNFEQLLDLSKSLVNDYYYEKSDIVHFIQVNYLDAFNSAAFQTWVKEE